MAIEVILTAVNSYQLLTKEAKKVHLDRSVCYLDRLVWLLD